MEAHLSQKFFRILKFYEGEIFSSQVDLVLWVEHSDLPSDATAGQDVGLLIVEGEGGPGQGVEVLLDVLVLVLHQHGPRVDVDDADTVAATGRHMGRGLVVVLRVRLKDNLKQFLVKTVCPEGGHPSMSLSKDWLKCSKLHTSQIWVWMSAGSLFFE